MRDPRAVFYSRILVLRKDDEHSYNNSVQILESVQNDCTQLYRDLYEIVLNDKFNYPHYFLLRYEDVAFNPEYLTSKLYETLNLTYSKQLDIWLQRSTNIHEKRKVRNSWSLKRTSNKVPFKWTRHLNQTIIKQIEHMCANVMDLLGYVKQSEPYNPQSTTTDNPAQLIRPASERLKHVLIT